MDPQATINAYIKAVPNGDWQRFLADEMTYGFNTHNHDQDRAGYIRGAQQFFSLATAVSVLECLIDGNRIAMINRYTIKTPAGPAPYDVAEFFTVQDGKITGCSLFFDQKGFRELVHG